MTKESTKETKVMKSLYSHRLIPPASVGVGGKLEKVTNTVKHNTVCE